MDKGLVNVDRVILEKELRDYMKLHENNPIDILNEIVSLHGKCQILEWESPYNRRYRFFIQELDSEDEPLPEIRHPLHLKEFTYNVN